MKLSVIIPVYHVIETLRACVESISCQRFRDYELLLVDDGSDDGCGELCDALALEDSRIRVIHRTENGGLSAARNTGIRAARGEYVTFLDSDDFIAEDTLRPLMNILAVHREYDILEYPVWIGYGGPSPRLLSLPDRVYTDMKEYWFHGQAYQHSYAWNKVYRVSLFQNVLFPEGKTFEDMHTLPELLKLAKCVATCGKGLYYYRYNKLGITATASGREYNDLLEAHLKALDQYTKAVDTQTTEFAAYYAHVLNIQLDAYEMTGQLPRLPAMRVRPVTWKLHLLNLIGIHKLCKLNQLVHSII